MSNLSELLPAGAGAKSAEFVASGTLGSGVTVALNADGTVEAVTSSGSPFSKGSPAVFDTNDPTEGLSVVYDSSNNKVVVVYSDSGNSSYGTAVVGTVSGTSISFGSAVVFNSSNSEKIGATFDANSNKVIAVWSQVIGTSLIAAVGTVSGTSISFGSNATFSNDGTGTPLKATFDSDSNKVIIVYRNDGNSNYGTAIVGTVSGTSISFGTGTVFQSSEVSHFGVTFDSSANKTVIGFQASSVGYGIVGTVSGTSISFGTRAAMDGSNNAERIFLTFDTVNNKSVFGYTARDSGEAAAAVVGTVSGTSISFGTPSFFISGDTGNYQVHGATYDNTAGRVVFSTKNESGSGISISSAYIDGTSLVFDATNALGETTFNFSPIVYDPDSNTVVCVYQDTANSSRGTSIVSTTDTFATNNTDFIGITDQAIADTATGAVIVQGGVSEKLSGLTVGADYYVQADGSLGSPTVSVPSNINNSTYDNKFLSVVGQELNSTGFRFSTDGTKVYIVGYGNDTVYQYSLSQAFEIDTASYDSVSFSVATQDTNPHGIAFNISGTKMYILGYGNNTVFQYSLSSAFDLSSASYDSVSFSVASQETQPQGIAFNSDGTKMYIVGFINDTVFQYSLSSSFDLSSASYDSVSFSVAGQDISPSGLCFNSNGSEMYVVGTTSDTIYQYSLSSSFDLSSASYNGASFNVSSEEAIPNDVYMRPDNLKFYVLGRSQDDLLQYSTGVGSVTSVPAGRALSSTSILLEG